MSDPMDRGLHGRLWTIMEQELAARGIDHPAADEYDSLFREIIDRVAKLIAAQIYKEAAAKLVDVMVQRFADDLESIASRVLPNLSERLTTDAIQEIKDQATLVASTRILTDPEVLADTKKSIEASAEYQNKEFGKVLDVLKPLTKLDNLLRLGRLEQFAFQVSDKLALPVGQAFEHLRPALPPAQEEDGA